MTDTSTKQTDFKTELDKIGKKLKQDTGMEPAEVIGTVITGLIISARMWKNAKRGDIARTIAWGVVLSNHHAQQRERLRTHRAKKLDRTFAAFN